MSTLICDRCTALQLMAACGLLSQASRSHHTFVQPSYPQEAQAHKLAGVLALEQKNPGQAFERLDQFDRMLPGDAGVVFLKGVALEGMGQRQAAAQQYSSYLRQSQQGNAAQYAYSRLKAWGYVK